jgi:hypothetical protein
LKTPRVTRFSCGMENNKQIFNFTLYTKMVIYRPIFDISGPPALLLGPTRKRGATSAKVWSRFGIGIRLETTRFRDVMAFAMWPPPFWLFVFFAKTPMNSQKSNQIKPDQTLGHCPCPLTFKGIVRAGRG